MKSLNFRVVILQIITTLFHFTDKMGVFIFVNDRKKLFPEDLNEVGEIEKDIYNFKSHVIIKGKEV